MLLAESHYCVGFLAFTSGKFQEAASQLEDAIRYVERRTPNLPFPTSARIRAGVSASVCWRWRHNCGRTGEAVKLADQGLRHARESGTRSTSLSLWNWERHFAGCGASRISSAAMPTRLAHYAKRSGLLNGLGMREYIEVGPLPNWGNSN